jgi:hypothetical protein
MAKSPKSDHQKASVVIECRMPAWKMGLRLIGFLLVIVLVGALIISDISIHNAKPHPHHPKELLLYGIFALFMSAICTPALFEARRVLVAADGLQLWTLWWRSDLSWPDILEFHHPSYLKVAMIRTRRCFYLLNKRDLTNYSELESRLENQVKPRPVKARKS